MKSLLVLVGLCALAAAQTVPAVGSIVCRYTGTTSSAVNYYTCSELAEKYVITVEDFFLLNPTVDKECSNIKPNTEYCVKGFIQSAVSTNGLCGPKNGNTICAGTEFGQCCNGETAKCGETAKDCAAGTCISGACDGFPDKYSMDGKCGPSGGGKICGGKWGNCCSKAGACGTGEAFCGVDVCYDGDCEAPPASTAPVPWQVGTTPDGTCGGAKGYTCDVVYGNCCSKEGECGAYVEHCGTGCQPEFGTCGTAGTGALASPDGSCGGTTKYTCTNTPFGTCCSISGFCGSTDAHCGNGCQSGFGECKADNVSPDGSCGGTNGYSCKGSTFGSCCSAAGWCGSSSDHCAAGTCQSTFGDCSAAASPTTTTVTAPRPTGLSPDGTCGGADRYKCAGSGFGDCCSPAGFCGSTTAHCGAGCQTSFGTCSVSASLSPDGTCGGTKGYKCAGSGFGDCCSSGGFCGSTTAHCSTGCQASFGTCSAVTNISPDGTCGGSKGYTCGGSTFGGCCGSSGFCGKAVEHCAQGCQKGFSNACLTTNVPTLDGSCGKAAGLTCAGGPFNGQCCGSSGFCGTTTAHCSASQGCQAGYGKCS